LQVQASRKILETIYVRGTMHAQAQHWVTQILRALDAFIAHTSFRNPDKDINRHDQLLTVLIGQMRQDLQPSHRDRDEDYKFRLKVRIVMHESYVPSGKVMDWTDIANLPMIWTGCQCPFHDVLQEKLKEYHLKPTRTHAVDNSIMKGLVVDGFGLALMREDDALQLAENPHVTVWDGGHLSVPLKIVWLSIHDDNEDLRIAREIIQNHWSETPVGD